MKDSDVDVLTWSPACGERADFDAGCEVVGEGSEEGWGSEEGGCFEGETGEKVQSVERCGGDGEGEAGGDVEGLGREGGWEGEGVRLKLEKRSLRKKERKAGMDRRDEQERREE